MKNRGMASDKGLRPTSPVHVHVEDDVPVHVHVKPKGKAKSKRPASVGGPVRSALSKKVTASARARSRSPGGGPWVPPPGKATKGSKVSWQLPSRVYNPRLYSPKPRHPRRKRVHFGRMTFPGGTHRLEINTPRDSLRMSDLSTDEEDQVHGQMRSYEKKIEGLMSEVGTLKNEAELQRTLKEIEQRDNLLDASRHVMEEQERNLEDCQDELTVTEHENRLLRKSMELLAEDADFTRHEASVLSGERENLMKKLIEVEMDGQAAAKQVSELRDAIRRLKEEHRMSNTDTARYAKQKDLLLEKLSDFEATNRTLRRLLREQHHFEAAAIRVGEQKDHLMRKLAEADRQNERLRIELGDRDRLLSEFRSQVHAQREENVALTGLQTSLESTRGHLQKQLRTKEADCNRMAVQIRTLEGQKAQDRIEIEHLQELLSTAKDKADRDKEALKKATRVQKQRATRSEDALETLNAQVMERESQLEDMRSQLDKMGPRYDKLGKEKAQVMAENSALKTRLGELESLMDRVENNTKAHQENVSAELHQKQAELSSLRIENERLKTSLTTIEEKFHAADEELIQLRGNLKHYETLVDEYKTQGVSVSQTQLPPPVSKSSLSTPLITKEPQMNRCRREADETIVQLEETRKETEDIQRDGEFELEKPTDPGKYFPISQQPPVTQQEGLYAQSPQAGYYQQPPPSSFYPTGPHMGGHGGSTPVKARLHNRLQELEPLPELLKSTELKLHDANERMHMYEHKNGENTKLIGELTAKVEHLSDTVESMRSKCHDSQDDNRLLQGKVDAMERKLRDAEDHSRDLMAAVAKAEEASHQQGLRLEEKSRENASLTRQLENALSDIRRQTEQTRDKASQKERTYVTRISDLESQLSQCRAEIARIKREKEENERKFNSRLYDLKDRLEQSHSTNRSMQNYVQFLKNSYANVFGDSTMTYPSTPVGGSGMP